MENDSSLRVLVVDDEPDILHLVGILLEFGGYRPVLFGSGAEALARIPAEIACFDAAVLDLHMLGVSGLDVLAEIRRLRPGLPVIVMTGRSEELARIDIGDLRIDGFLRKPFEAEDLVESIRRVAGGR